MDKTKQIIHIPYIEEQSGLIQFLTSKLEVDAYNLYQRMRVEVGYLREIESDLYQNVENITKDLEMWNMEDDYFGRYE